MSIFGKMLAVLLAALVIAATSNTVDINPLPTPAIRDFDLATILRLGREMYDQDQLAWKASDIMIEQRTKAVAEKDGIAGWVTETVGGKSLVRFLKRGDGGPEILYDVTFETGKDPAFSIPADHKANAEEIAQFEARDIARKNVGNSCSQTYNTVALKDPSGDGWIVWVMASTTTDKDAVIIGGHVRFTISADGKTIKQRDALSKSCLRLRRPPPATAGNEVEGSFVSHIVSLTPVETHVFANLAYKIKFFISTPDGRSWKVDNGAIAQTDMDDPGADGFTARMFIGQDEKCVALAKKSGDSSAKSETVGDFKVISATEGDAKFKLTLPDGYKADAVMCGRNDIIPAPNDYKVLFDAGLPLALVDNGAGHPRQRMGWLEAKDGRLRFEMREGALTDEDQKRLQKRLDLMQTTSQKH